MNKFTLMFGIGALALASCSNDDLVVNPNVDEAAESAIGFAVSTGNMTRSTQLSEEHWDFGVWAYKSTAGTPAATDPAIMENYMVGFWDIDNTQGYKPTNDQLLEGSNVEHYAWYYETLGKNQKVAWTDDDGISGKAGSEFIVGSSNHKASTSEVNYQYLKYWDRAADTKNWFYAYAPYSLNTDTAKVSFAEGSRTMTFPTISSIKDNGKSAMYASELVESPGVTSSTKRVDLDFKRLLAQVRLAFYEEVAGYTVELIDYSTSVSIPDTDPWENFGKSAMFAVPATKTGDDYDTGQYVTSAKPKVTFANNLESETITYSEQSLTSTNINIPLWFFDKDDNQTNILGTSRTLAIMNQAKEVLPSGDTFCGFTLNLSLRFKSVDTGETIDVRGVRVHIPAEDCQWLANTRYTYYFKVTKNVPGSPSDPGTPSVDPGTDPYLLPIVFDKVTVEALDEVSKPNDPENPTIDYYPVN